MSGQDDNDTRQRLARITDAGYFEKLATAVLREEDPHCRRLAHIGVNAEGKTIKNPVDGIVYTSVDGQRLMLAVHHTTRLIKDLRRKWLTDPNSDLCKTLRELEAQRENTPELGATLILTTNKEPELGLIHDVETAGWKAGIEIKVWPGSALADFLDNDPQGQWIRKRFLGIDPTRLSRELLYELSVRSVELAPLVDDPEQWVEREVDAKLRNRPPHWVQFILGESGTGKSVACLKCLRQQVHAGGFGFIVTDEVLGTSLTVEEAIERTLLKLQPNLAGGAGSEALSLVSKNEQILLVIEDVNRSAQPVRPVEKLAAWSRRGTTGEGGVRWRILCPVWPRTLALASSNTDKIVNEATITVASFTRREGIAAVKRRCPQATDLEVEVVASALGFDPLLIALHGGNDATSEPETVIQSYVERELQRSATTGGTYTAGEYRNTLRTLALEMLKRGQLKPDFNDVRNWTTEEHSITAMLRDLARHREVIRLEETTENQRIEFRHDRVRDYLLADAVEDAISRDDLSAEVMSDPYFSEIVGMAIASGGVASEVIDKIVYANPLALFCSLRHCSRLEVEPARYLIDEAKRWAERSDWWDPLNETLHTAILRVLAECDGPHIRELCNTMGGEFPEIWSLRGRFRNGDLYAGVLLCAQEAPGVGWAGHVELIDHVAKKGGRRFIRALGELLRCGELSEAGRRGALRLAGFVANSDLAEILRECWKNDLSRNELLPDYFWACAQCCGDDPIGLLEPIVDAWAAMPGDEEAGHRSPRVEFGADELRWALRDRVPVKAIGYLLQRARDPELRWSMAVMLHGIDHPDAVEFVVRELAEGLERTEEFWSIAANAVDEWRGRQISLSYKSHRMRREGSPMSTDSRERLVEIWSCNAYGEHLRRQAFLFWSANVAGDDIPILRTIDADSDLGDLALFERLRRADRTAISALVEKLGGADSGWWWQAGRYLWTEELTDCLDRALARRAAELTNAKGDEGEDPDWILAEQLMGLSPRTAERLISEHWAGLRHSAFYVHAALHVASPGLLESVSEVVAASDDPKSLFEHLNFGMGPKVDGRSVVTRRAQIDGLLPYLEYLSEIDIKILWEACNQNSWFEWRRQHLDSRANTESIRFVDDTAALDELDCELNRDRPLLRMDDWGRNVPGDRSFGRPPDEISRRLGLGSRSGQGAVDGRRTGHTFWKSTSRRIANAA